MASKNQRYKAIIYEVIRDETGGEIRMRPVTTAQNLSVAEAATILGVTRDGVYRLIEFGHLPASRPTPGRITISIEDVYRHKEATKDPEFWDGKDFKRKPGKQRARR